MGYISHYKIYDSKGKCLGTFRGWTGDEAIKSAKKYHPDWDIQSAKHTGTAEPTR
jgi:hypothetical protein